MAKRAKSPTGAEHKTPVKKRTRQGAGQHSKPRHNKKRYRGQGR